MPLLQTESLRDCGGACAGKFSASTGADGGCWGVFWYLTRFVPSVGLTRTFAWFIGWAFSMTKARRMVMNLSAQMLGRNWGYGCWRSLFGFSPLLATERSVTSHPVSPSQCVVKCVKKHRLLERPVRQYCGKSRWIKFNSNILYTRHLC